MQIEVAAVVIVACAAKLQQTHWYRPLSAGALMQIKQSLDGIYANGYPHAGRCSTRVTWTGRIRVCV
jgi:hypothetical protein